MHRWEIASVQAGKNQERCGLTWYLWNSTNLSTPDLNKEQISLVHWLTGKFRNLSLGYPNHVTKGIPITTLILVRCSLGCGERCY